MPLLPSLFAACAALKTLTFPALQPSVRLLAQEIKTSPRWPGTLQLDAHRMHHGPHLSEWWQEGIWGGCPMVTLPQSRGPATRTGGQGAAARPPPRRCVWSRGSCSVTGYLSGQQLKSRIPPHNPQVRPRSHSLLRTTLFP